MTAAKRRWNMLAEVIISSRAKTESDNSIHSVRRFTSFGLFHIEPTNDTFHEASNVTRPGGCLGDELSNGDVTHDRGLCNGDVTHDRGLCNGDVTHDRGLCNGDVTRDSRLSDPTKDMPSSDIHNWFEYTLPSLFDQSLYIRHLPQKLSPQTLKGFNNTGNVCVWVSEEVMSYHCLLNKQSFKNKSICELGGGMTCLAGITIAKCVETKEVLLTDGNNEAVTNVSQIINVNMNTSQSSTVSARCLRWPPSDDISDLHQRFDVIICADCLFFDDGRKDLIDLMDKLLKPEGEVVIFAPARGATLDTFVQLASHTFSIQVTRHYDEHVTRLHFEMKEKGLEVYDEGLHYPLLIHMTRRIAVT